MKRKTGRVKVAAEAAASLVVWLAARTFRVRARRSPGAWLKYHGWNNIKTKVDLAEPGGKAVNFAFCRLL